MVQTVQQALRQAEFYTDNQPYVFVQLPVGAVMAAAGVVAEVSEPFCALIVDKDEVSLLLPAEAYEDFSKRLPGSTLSPISYRLITIDIPLEPDLVGFMAHVSQALAAANVSILTFAAFSRDHFFVPAKQFESAVAALKELQRL